MGKCLVTKLNGTVNNNDLLHIGECVVGVESKSSKETLFSLDLGNFEYYCEQPHVLGEENVDAGVKRKFEGWRDIKSFVAGLYRFHFLNKYFIKGLITRSSNNLNEVTQLNFLNNITQIVLYSDDSFDLDNLKQSTSLAFISLKGNIVGDISSLKNMTALTNLTVNSTQVTGDISSLKKMTALVSLSGKCFINGKAEELKMFPNLTTFDCENAVNKGDFGDIAALPSEFKYLNIGENASISWSSRPSSSKIISIFYSPKLSNIDKMLQDQAQCVIGITSSTPEYMKSITATGTRTSASDAAVQTLQSKGYTVSITPA